MPGHVFHTFSCYGFFLMLLGFNIKLIVLSNSQAKFTKNLN